MPAQAKQQQTPASGSYPDIERIYREWDRALSNNDTAAILALYAPDATLESPLVSHLMGTESGVCRGREELKRLFEILATRKPKIRKFYRTGYFTDGHKIMWEYPHDTPEDEQMDFVEVMEIENGLIQKHRVYWGWFGFNVLKNNQYRQ
ncbi:MAG TPA: nuclear transport factor 2 family protein [Bryobacteraceae bacterium]|nr:nuclear transport factor 2 family protein [Bryobacteraceae bacterium]